MKLAILGTRGVPPRYGGFETFAAELGRRLVLRGHNVTVYCRPAGGPRRQSLSEWEGIKRIELPAAGHKYFETVSHTLLSAIDALRRDFDLHHRGQARPNRDKLRHPWHPVAREGNGDAGADERAIATSVRTEKVYVEPLRDNDGPRAGRAITLKDAEPEVRKPPPLSGVKF